MATLNKLIVIVGTTASGKSAAAIQMAQQYNGEIICADSRTIYKGMDIGTAKPSKEDQKLVPHHLLDTINPDQKFSVAQFQKLANKTIKDVQQRGKLPILVGGTGLYIDAVIYDYEFREGNPKLRQELEKLTIDELQARIKKLDLDLPENTQNPRHLVKVLETNGADAGKQQLRGNTLVLGIEVPTDTLKDLIEARVNQMVGQGLEQEVKNLATQYSWEAEAMKGIGYREWQEYFNDKQSLEETKQLIIKNTWQYVRRQRTWFKRNRDIHWQNTVRRPS